MLIISSILLIFLGIVIGVSMIAYIFKKKSQDFFKIIENLKEENRKKTSDNEQSLTLIEIHKETIKKNDEELKELRSSKEELITNFTAEKTKNDQLLSQINENEEEAKERHKQSLLEFENLANKILNENSKKFGESSKETLCNLLNPLKNDIKNYQETIQKTHKEDIEGRTALKTQINYMMDGAKGLQSSSDSLTKALKGDSKTQGKWGELILEKVLENSGLRKGHEYTAQTQYIGEDGGRCLPDITLYLSDKKIIFIDAKVSLTHYDTYTNAEDESQKSSAEDSLVKSFCDHIETLSKKNYHSIQDVNTTDFVIMFTPIESALAVAVQSFDKNNREKKEKTFFEYAWNRGIIISSPITLMPILKTIDLCWKAELQNKHADRIGEEANKLYDKFVNFLVELGKLGEGIDKTQNLFNKVRSLLSEGKGNIIRRTENIRALLKKKRGKMLDEYFSDNEDGYLDEESGELTDCQGSSEAQLQLSMETR